MWEGMNKEELEQQYSPSSCVNNFDELIEQYTVRSKVSEKSSKVQKDIRYGEQDDELLDLFVTNRSGAPLLVFIHGGYWQALSKNESTFAGSELAEAGVSYAAIDYTIAPKGKIAHMIDQCVKAVLWLKDNAANGGYSSDDIYLAGSSAGAHLATMTTLKLKEIIQPCVKGLILLSGVYDVQPLVNTYVNDPLGLTMEEARMLSPLNYDLKDMPPALIYYGENETDEFKRQSQSFAKDIREAGSLADCKEISGYNHFDIVHQLPTFWNSLQKVIHN